MILVVWCLRVKAVVKDMKEAGILNMAKSAIREQPLALWPGTCVTLDIILQQVLLILGPVPQMQGGQVYC